MYTPEFFTSIFYLSTSIILILIFIDSHYEWNIFNSKKIEVFAFCYLLFLLLLLGSRPIGESGFMDSKMYIDWFLETVKAKQNIVLKDIVFGYFVYFSTFITNVRGFFILCSFVSIFLLYKTSKIISNDKWFLFFICYISSLYYWNYNVYALRQGLATYLFLYAFFIKNKYIRIILLLLAIGTHKSIALPVLLLVVSYLTRKNKLLFLFWLISIPISYFYGTFVEIFISKLISDPRSQYFLEVNKSGYFSRLGFRWDMIFYSSIFIAIGYYNLFVKKIADAKYVNIVNFYTLTSIVFILIIRINHAHRFAYLSWFLAPLVVFYPYFDSKTHYISYKNYSKILILLFLIVIIHHLKINYL